MSETAGSTTQTNQQSSSDQSQSTSSDQGNGGSNLTQTTRPDYVVNDAHWDAATGTVKPEFTAAVTEAFQIADQHHARLAALPKDATEYQVVPPKEFKLPDGWKVDDKHPLAAPIRAIAHKHQASQELVSDLVQAFGEMQIAENKTYNEAVAAETKKLGPNATTRVTALKTWLTAHLGAEAANDLLGTDNTGGLLIYSDAAVRYLEKLQLATTSQGAAPHLNGGREPPAPPPRTAEEVLYPQQARKVS